MIIGSRSAFLLVDPQRDFFSGGAFPLVGADALVEVWNRYLGRFSQPRLPIFVSRYDLSPGSKRFISNGGKWPPHCLRGTQGAQFHSGLKFQITAYAIRVISKETDSAFQGKHESGKDLLTLLKEEEIKEVFIAGIGTESGVKASALDAKRAGFDVFVALDGICGLSQNAADSQAAVEEMKKEGVIPYLWQGPAPT